MARKTTRVNARQVRVTPNLRPSLLGLSRTGKLLLSVGASRYGTYMPAPDPAQRDRILREALAILARDGERGLVVRAVARAAGCSTTGVYTYFDGRPGLLDAIVVEGFEQLDSAVVAATAGVPPGPAALEACCRAYTQFAAANPTHYELMFATPVPDFERSTAASARGVSSFELFRDVVSEAIDAGTMSSDGASPALIAGTLWATLHGHASVRNVWPPESSPNLPWEHDVDKAVGWLLSGIGRTSQHDG